MLVAVSVRATLGLATQVRLTYGVALTVRIKFFFCQIRSVSTVQSLSHIIFKMFQSVLTSRMVRENIFSKTFLFLDLDSRMVRCEMICALLLDLLPRLFFPLDLQDAFVLSIPPMPPYRTFNFFFFQKLHMASNPILSRSLSPTKLSSRRIVRSCCKFFHPNLVFLLLPYQF